MKSAIVTNEAQFPELSHEKIDALPRCANHFREHLLRYSGKHPLRLGFLGVASQQQQSSSQAFLAGVKKLIDQILLDADVPGKNVKHKAVAERMSFAASYFRADLATRGLAISFFTPARVALR